MNEDGVKRLAQYGDNVRGLGTYIENPGIEIDWTQYAKHGIKRVQQRGLTQESITQSGKVLSQDNGNKFVYVYNQGGCE